MGAGAVPLALVSLGWLSPSSSAGAFGSPAGPTRDEPAAGVRRFEDVRSIARRLAEDPIRAPEEGLPAELRALDYDAYRKIRFREERTLWAEEDPGFSIQLHHRGYLFTRAVDIYLLEEGEARHLRFSPSMFHYEGIRPEGLESSLGFAGFQISYRDERESARAGVVSFLGASYFRAVGIGGVMGTSARALAIDAGLGEPEEFPFFRTFWLRRPQTGDRTVEILALLDSPSASGAYRFVVAPGSTTRIEVEATVFPRVPGKKLCLAPLSSMFWYGPSGHDHLRDHRGQVHDSDGLLLADGTGEFLFRPLRNPAASRISRFRLAHPVGFGLVQRERAAASYGDREALYHERPSVWISPRGDWGTGVVELLELPAEHEGLDNIAAWWLPEGLESDSGEKMPLGFHYMLAFGSRDVEPDHGGGSAVGYTLLPTDSDAAQVRVEFQGGRLTELPESAAVEAEVDASGGQVEGIGVQRTPEGSFAVTFLVERTATAPVELRAFLRSGPEALTESWSYSWCR